jgi:hypothetical protein
MPLKKGVPPEKKSAQEKSACKAFGLCDYFATGFD